MIQDLDSDDRGMARASGADAAVAALKIPPHSVEAEQSLLGALLIDNLAFDKIADVVVEADFYRHDHRLIFDAIARLLNAGKPADVVTVHELLQTLAKHEEAGGLPYLNSLANSVASAGNVRRYAEIVRDRATLRQLIGVTDDIAASAFNTQGKSVAQIVDEAESRIFAVGEAGQRGHKGFHKMPELLHQVLERTEELRQHEGDVTGTRTHLIEIDRMTSGLQAGDLIVVAGRPSMGKTSLAMNIAENVALHEHLPVAVFSMEMAATQLVVRIVGSIGRIDQSRLRSGKLNDDEFSRLVDTVEQLNNAPIYIDDTGGLNPLELRARARRLARSLGKLGLIVVDYLQLMSSTREGENRATEISEISRALKSLGKELQCPVIALSQLNRDLEKRSDKRPVMSDLRESGAIEQDADLILFIYRDEVYIKDSKDAGIAEIIIAKQRNGPVGTVRMAFLKHLTRFENLASGSYYDD
jgi:replicative DNA helicase